MLTRKQMLNLRAGHTVFMIDKYWTRVVRVQLKGKLWVFVEHWGFSVTIGDQWLDGLGKRGTHAYTTYRQAHRALQKYPKGQSWPHYIAA